MNTKEDNPGFFYDRIAKLHNWTFKFNRYEHSIEQYMRANPLPLPAGARILDAGSGTGLLTLALLKTLKRPAHIVALDLSAASLKVSQRDIAETLEGRPHEVWLTQANVLELPFADDSFDLIVTSGALEYVPLEDGLSEMARVLIPGGYFLHLPVRLSVISRLLEWVYRFKAHPPQELAENTNRYFQVVDHYRFPPLDPIGWTKTAVLAQKV